MKNDEFFCTAAHYTQKQPIKILKKHFCCYKNDLKKKYMKMRDKQN